MKTLQELLYKVGIQQLIGNTQLNVSHITFDSRQVQEGSLFVAIRGTQIDGHQFIDATIAQGAKAVVCEMMPETRNSGVTYVQVLDAKVALAVLATNFYDHPSNKLKLVGVTGTNGKTTTATILFETFRKMGYPVGLLSTVGNRINDQLIPTLYTTPDALNLNQLLNQMAEAGCTHCFMEVSSHAVVQKRVTGLHFVGGIFTNLTHDHLDFHKTFPEYLKAKKAFFDTLSKESFALVNKDDKNGLVMVQNTKAHVFTYGLRQDVDFRCTVVENDFSGLVLRIDQHEVHAQLIGSFNAYNISAAYSAGILLGEEPTSLLTALSAVRTVSGRFDYLSGKNQVVAVVDYAHTPDALQNVLQTIHNITQKQRRIITVVGCGGNRDKAKRPIMAQIACHYSDKIILTSDNPRNEDPNEIINEMELGVSIENQLKTLKILDRKEAIRMACLMAQKGDVILVAGKGHETYQEIKGVRYSFDDKAILQEFLTN